MIKRIKLTNFKRFKEQEFALTDNIVLAGTNNSGKTTLLQALAVWNLTLQKWLLERGPTSPSKARKRTGVAITRKEFTAIPLREMNLLWTDCSTALHREELEMDVRLGTPRFIKIRVDGNGSNGDWSLSFDLNYQGPEQIYGKPSADTPVEANTQLYKEIKDLQIVHVPPFSGIGSDETRYDRAYQDLLIGQGKPGDILRNLLYDVYSGSQDGSNRWTALCNNIEDIFACKLLSPQYEGQPFILCQYQHRRPGKDGYKGSPKLDISCAGSGFLQVLMLLGFFYARPASILLLDEPDAHLHVILQKQVYDRLRKIARETDCQLVIATHSEVLVDGTSPEKILSFFKSPHILLDDTQRDQIREALKRLTTLDILLAEQSPGILYVEGETDFNLLREWARVLNHPSSELLWKDTFWHNNQGRNPREAKAHFFALRAIRENILGTLILDGDNRNLENHEISAEGLTILRWTRYEAESYLIHPKVLSRFIEGGTTDLFKQESAKNGLQYLRNELPPGVFNNPLMQHAYLESTPASKTLLPGFFEAAEIKLTKQEYYQIAAQMLPEEIPKEVSEKLDKILEALSLDANKIDQD